MEKSVNNQLQPQNLAIAANGLEPDVSEQIQLIERAQEQAKQPEAEPSKSNAELKDLHSGSIESVDKQVETIDENPENTDEAEISKNTKDLTLPDKSIKKNKDWEKVWKFIDKTASNTALYSNLLLSFTQLMNIPEKTKTGIAKFVDLVTNLSFVPYGLDGMKKAFLENKNPYMFLGFFMELSMVWMSDLKNKYLIRGAATATDQIWVATQHKLMDKDPIRFKDGKFQNWKDGFIETAVACKEMLKDIFTNPAKALLTLDKEKGSSGYYALLSSIGSFASTVGYFLTRNEKFFGTMRDISASLFDGEMLLDKKPIAKASGVLFIAESVLDFAAKFISDNSTRLFVNMLSHAAGRQALQFYKNSNEVSHSDVTNAQNKNDGKLDLKNLFGFGIAA